MKRKTTPITWGKASSDTAQRAAWLAEAGHEASRGEDTSPADEETQKGVLAEGCEGPARDETTQIA